MSRSQNKFTSVLTGTMVLFFSQSAHADLGSIIKISKMVAMQSTTMDAIGTGSTGSYSHNEKKGAEVRRKSYAHGKNHHGSKKSHAYTHNKSEGSRSKSYAHGKSHHSHKRASAHGGHGSHGSSPFKHVMHYKYKLGLTDAQITTMKKLDVDFKKKIIQAKADHEKAHLELDLQVHSGKVDEAKIRAAGAKIVASKTGKIMAMIEAKIKLLQLLTTVQRQKMAKIH